ncbi:hypothetical protein HMN09_01052000 [Mycena chlorophos]|uniref:Fungal-type protein kinase domain-containing protein n=1 Tax=Mycena chlorophos TaxID=658473 RepID=A0A8H6SCZ8_MYCCL|nr:hypothetical protein HMN09_01052000 [Mycena chlorophos]
MSNPQTPPASASASSPSATRVQSDAPAAPHPARHATPLPAVAPAHHTVKTLDGTPRKEKIGSVHTSQANTADVLLQSHGPTKDKWYSSTVGGYAYRQGGEAMDLLDRYMAPRGPAELSAEDATVAAILANEDLQPLLEKATRAANHKKKSKTTGRRLRQEPKIAPALIEVLETMVESFDDAHRPLVEDGQAKRIGPLDKGDHYTGPDILIGLPGHFEAALGRNWALSKVIELKDVTEIFDENGAVVDSNEAREAMTQLSKSARSLLMFSHRTHTWVTAVFQRRYARIFCFDRTGFVVSSKFDWIKEPKVFATLYYRLFHPPGHTGRIDGDDFTIERLSDSETDQHRKARLFAAIQDHEYYKDKYSTLEEISDSLLAIRASRRDDQGTEREVTCLAFGDLLSQSDGLFSRATTVFRVIIEEDLEERQPGSQVGVYALKDAWRESCRQPEADFYDTIARYCRESGIDMQNMAQCHGSVDVGTLSGENNGVHTTRFLRLQETQKREEHLRVHVRTLLTPVGIPLNEFPSIQTLIGGLYNAMTHHQIAFNAGVLHRDVSEGNVMLVEATPKDELPKGFLMDWDYAEFTVAGAKAFNDWIAENAADREPVTTDSDKVDKKLKDITGTRPYMAIEILEASIGTVVRNLRPEDAKVRHGAHHDLESFYWLLVWMVLRHTEHTGGDRAAAKLFDAEDVPTMKRGYTQKASPANPTASPLLMRTTARRDLLQHDSVLELFKEAFEATTWGDNDNAPAKPFTPPPNQTKYDRGPSTKAGNDADTQAPDASDDGDSDVEMSGQDEDEESESANEQLQKAKKKSTPAAGGSGKRQRQEVEDPELNAGSGSKKRRTAAPRAAGNTSGGSAQTSDRSLRPRDEKGRVKGKK